MVECECGWAGTIEEMISGFNRYMVECELIRKRMTAQIFLCFNRYMVECELCYELKRQGKG